jgi:hypothetical protein
MSTRIFKTSSGAIKVARRGISLALALTLVGALTGCDPANVFTVETIQMRLSSAGEVEVVVCEPIQVIRGSAWLRSSAEHREAIWESDERASIPAGSTGTLGREPFGFEATLDEAPTLSAGDTLTILLTGDEQESAWGSFSIKNPESIVGVWLDSDGTTTVEPCISSSNEP